MISQYSVQASSSGQRRAAAPGSIFSRTGTGGQWPLLRYAQCWEDADVLLESMNVRSGDVLLSIASGGENTLALLACSPGKVIAVDQNPAQLCCLQLKASAFRNLSYDELLVFMGSRHALAGERQSLYRGLRADLDPACARYFDEHPDMIGQGISSQGKFESYFALFRKFVLPLIHNVSTVGRLFAGQTLEQRRRFYDEVWNTPAWRLMFRIFFSRQVMGLAGRAPELFKYVEGPTAERILERVHLGLTEIDTRDNPYLQWILFGRHLSALPFALRPENFQAIRRNLDALTLKCSTIDACLDTLNDCSLNGCNLSDIFEYMSAEEYVALLRKLCQKTVSGGRLVYWNMLVPRRSPPVLHQDLIVMIDIASQCQRRDKAFFYSQFVVEEVA